MMKLWLHGVVLACVVPVLSVSQAAAQTSAPSTAAAGATKGDAMKAGVMKAADVQKVLPPTVFFRGLSAPVQARNSGGVLFDNKQMMLVSLVDTSGYSTSVQEKYQAYLLTEVPLEIGGQKLVPGAYGCGFIAGDKFIVQDVGAHDLFTATSTRDAELKRPTPLQVLAGPKTGEYRLYAGRSFVTIKAAGQ